MYVKVYQNPEFSFCAASCSSSSSSSSCSCLLFVVCFLLLLLLLLFFCCCCRCRCCCCCCRCCCNASYFRILWASKDLHIGGVFVSEAENHGIYSVFLLLETKFTVFTLFFGPGLAKTLVFTQFSACCKKNLFHA